MLGAGDLVLCAATIPHASFRERIAAAQAGGFRGVSLRVGDYTRARAEGLDDAEIRRMLLDAGVEVTEIEALADWRPGAPRGRKTPSEAQVFAAAVASGARGVSLIEGPGAPLPIASAAPAFAMVCDRAAEHGLRVHIECWPGSGLDLATAAAVVVAAGRPNGGLMIDTWHLARTAGGDTLLRDLPGRFVTSVQVSDSPLVAAPELDYLAATLHRRRLPGDGELDLIGFVQQLDAAGSIAPIGLEVCSDALAALPPAVAAQQAGSAIRAVLEAARATFLDD